MTRSTDGGEAVHTQVAVEGSREEVKANPTPGTETADLIAELLAGHWAQSYEGNPRLVPPSDLERRAADALTSKDKENERLKADHPGWVRADRAIAHESRALSLSLENEKLKADHHRRGVKIVEMAEHAGAHLCRAEAAERQVALRDFLLAIATASLKTAFDDLDRQQFAAEALSIGRGGEDQGVSTETERGDGALPVPSPGPLSDGGES